MYDRRYVLKKIFEDTLNHCKEDEILKQAIETSKSGQYVVDSDTKLEERVGHRYNDNSNIVISNSRTFMAAKKYVGQKICVLNFASSTLPGGGVINGSSAQEECLCRCSTLYVNISSKETYTDFYEKHYRLLNTFKMDATYNDDIIYTPDVVVFKDDIDFPTLLEEDEYFKVDVITCAAPNLRRIKEIAKDNLKRIFIKRIKRILEVAVREEVDALVLGAFGCGAYGNPPELVAEAMKEAISEYMMDFRTIEFAIYCPPEDDTNYQIFKKVFLNK